MSRLYGIGAAGLWLGGVAAVMAGFVAWVLAEHRDAPGQVTMAVEAADEAVVAHAGPEPASKSPGPADEPAAESGPDASSAGAKGDASDFLDPAVVARRFTAGLSRLVKHGKLVAPAEIFRQAGAAKTCSVVPLPDPGQKLSPEAVYARAKPGVVVVGAIDRPEGGKHWNASLASGFVIGKDGIIATNYHVIEAFHRSKAVGVMTDDRRVFPVKAVLAADSHNDVAVLKIEANNLTALPIAANVPVGAPVFCLSHPALDSENTETAFYAFTQGVVCGKFRLRFNGPMPLDVLTITAEYAKGSSGGPILNEHGAVVGIICQTRTLFYDEDETEPQLTWKFSRPSSSLLAMLKGPAGAKTP